MICLCCLERAHGCLGAWEGGPGVPGPLPWAPGARPRGLPGGGSRPNVCGPLMGMPPLNSHQILCRFLCRFLVVLGSILGPSWGHLGAILGSSWRLFRPKWVPDPSSNCLIIEKVIVREMLCFPSFATVNANVTLKSKHTNRNDLFILRQ